MIDFRSENSEVVLNFTLLLLDLLFQNIDVFLLIAKQKYKIVGKDIRMVSHQVAQLWNVAASHRNFWPRHVLPRIDWSKCLTLGRQTAIAFVEIIRWEIIEDGGMGGLGSGLWHVCVRSFRSLEVWSVVRIHNVEFLYFKILRSINSFSLSITSSEYLLTNI